MQCNVEYSACNGCPEIQGSVNAHIVSTSETLSFFQENVIIFVFVFAFVFLPGKCYHFCLCCRYATNFVFLSGKCYFSILRTNPRRSRGFIPCKSFVFCREIQIFVLCKSFVFSQRNTTLSIISDAAVIYEELAGGEIEKWKS